MANDRPPIPDELERKVREKCNFSCVLCGNQIYDIDHIDDWAEVQKHEYDNLTLLCTMHHRLKNKGILDKELIRDRTKNIVHRPTGGLPDINLKEFNLILGNNLIAGMPRLCFLIDGKDFLALDYDAEINQVVINAGFFDNSGNLIFKIQNNRYSYSTNLWDVKSSGNKIIIREGFRKRLLIIEIYGTGEISIFGKIYFDDNRFILLDKNGIHCNGKKLLSECTVVNCRNGMIISDNPNIGGCFLNVTGGVKNVAVGSGIGISYTKAFLNKIYES